MSVARVPLDRARRRAGLVLWIEQLWPALLPAAGLIALYAVLSLLTVPQRLAPWLHGLVLALLLAGVWLLVGRGVRGLASPPAGLRDRRIERASKLAHRPLATLRDRPAMAMAGGAALLWEAHLVRTGDGLAGLQTGRPILSLHQRDRFGVAPALLAALMAAGLLSGRDAPLRLESGFWPGVALPLGPVPSLQAWITPPDYASGAPVFLTDPHGRYVVPQGARLSVSLTGSDAMPRLSTGLDGGGSFARLSERSWSLARTLDATADGGARLRIVEAGYPLADWRIVVQPIPAPEVAWTSPPGADPTRPWHTRLPWSATQRYGIRSLVAEMRLAAGTPGGRVLRVAIPLSGSPAEGRGVFVPDLSADPWAGTKVTARLVATDQSGQIASSADAAFTLPARPFRNPLARAVLDVRRRLATGREDVSGAADDLTALGDTPGAFAQDTGLFLNLSTVVSLLRLPSEDPHGQAAQAEDRLWSLALALEDGLHNDRATARAAQAVRAAQDRLSAQIEHMRQLGPQGQSTAEQEALKARITALGAAIAAKMQAMAAEAAREHKIMPPLPDAASLGGQDLDRMLRQMQQQAASGHTDQAMQALSQMQAMLDHMRMATPQDLQSAEQQAQATAAARDQMQAVQDLVKRQTTLLDSTQNRLSATDRAEAQAEANGTMQEGEDSRNGPPDAATRALLQRLGIPDVAAPPPAPAPGALPDQDQTRQAAARQQDRHAQSVLRRALDELVTEFAGLTGKKADALETASKEMQSAHDALSAARDRDADAAQIKALAALQKGQGQMSSAMQGGRSGGAGLALLPGTGSGAEDGDEDGMPTPDAQLGSDEGGPRDPLGRPIGDGHGGHDDGDETHIPGADNSARSRQIEQELRRRDSDRTRPQPELDYLDRLLKSF